MSEYRDIGSLMPPDYIVPYPRADQLVNTERKSQVYQATHRGDGIRLPYMNRSFISFTYGGKHIEDFNLIATISGDRLNRNGYANFDDTISTYDNLDGQHYWTTHYKTNQMDFTLSTDGIDQKQLDNFLYWFRAGISRELILAEHPNRAIMARVAQPPTLNLLPFEQDVTLRISSINYKTKTTLYKGDINLSLVMDQPHWYAITNILGKRVESMTGGIDRFVDQWDDPFTGEKDISIFASQDALKILYEDGIPLGSMIEANMLLGNGAYANIQNQLEGCIWDPDQTSSGHPLGTARICGTITELAYGTNGRNIFAMQSGYPIVTESGEYIKYDMPSDFEEDYRELTPGEYKNIGVIAGAIVDATNKGITSFSPGSQGFFFYAGTAPSPTLIEFSLTPEFSSGGYFTSISNKYTYPTFNTITITSEREQKLVMTAPSLYTNYHTALEIMKTLYNKSIVEVRQDIRNNVKHPAVRAWCMALLSDEEFDMSIEDQVIYDKMKQLFQNDDGEYDPISFSFNSETGEAIGTLHYRVPENDFGMKNFVYDTGALNLISTVRDNTELTTKQRYQILEVVEWDHYCVDSEGNQIIPSDEDESSYATAVLAFLNNFEQHMSAGIPMEGIFNISVSPVNASTYTTVKEDVGDMLQSNNIVIVDRNYFTSEGKVINWADTEEGHRYSHKIWHDFPCSLTNFQIIYKNMYL